MAVKEPANEGAGISRNADGGLVNYPIDVSIFTGSQQKLSRTEEELLFLGSLSGGGSPGRLYHAVKRAADLVISVGALVALSPVLLVIGLIIMLDDGAPVLFRQTRIGQFGRPFTFYKFRSMVRNAEALKKNLIDLNEHKGPIFKIRNDPRVTRVGRILRKLSLDELPQLLNVVKGEVSIVGPRPHLPHEVEKYILFEQERLKVKPGLLCLREVCGRSDITFERWIELDLVYIQHRSLMTDLRIFLRAVRTIVARQGAY